MKELVATVSATTKRNHRPKSLIAYRSQHDQSSIQCALGYIPPDVGRDVWVKIGMALNSELGREGYEVFNEWSKYGQSYNESNCRTTWNSFDSDGGIRIGTLFEIAKKYGWKPEKRSRAGSHAKSDSKASRAPQTPQNPQEGLDKAKAYWGKGKPVDKHPYATRKGLKPNGLRVLGDWLLIPLYDNEMQLSSVQRISPQGKKLFLKGCVTKSCSYLIGKPVNNTLFICEGWATGETMHQATGDAVAVAFSCSNFAHVAREMRQRFTGLVIVLVPDRDKNQVAEVQANAAAVNYDCELLVPQFPNGISGTDFNDLHLAKGLEEVKLQMETNRIQIQKQDTDTVGSEPVTSELQRKIMRVPDFPLDALGDVLGPAAKAIAKMVQAPPHLAGQSILSAAALVAQALANVQIDDRTYPLSLFCLTVGESGERKSACDKEALKPHLEWERKQQKTSESEQKPLVQRVFLCTEPTLEGLQISFRYGLASQGLFSDEGGQFLGGHAMNPENALKTMAGLSAFWDGRPIKRIRAGKGESWIGSDRRLSLHLMVQPIVANAALSNPLLQQQGILARFLIASGNHLFGLRSYATPMSEDKAQIRKYHQRLSELLTRSWSVEEDGGLVLPPLCLTGDAMTLWVHAYDKIERGNADGGEYEAIRGAASKMPENIARIAGVLAVISGRHEIDAETMKNAICLGDYYLDQYSLNTRTGSKYKQDAQLQRLIDWLRNFAQKEGVNTLDANTINTKAPTDTGVRSSVDNVRLLMEKLSNLGFVVCVESNTRKSPTRWKILE